MAVPLTIQNSHCDPTKVILNLYAAVDGATGGGNLELEYGVTKDILMPDFLFPEAEGASVSYSDEESEELLASVAQMRGRIQELENELSSREEAESAQPAQSADVTGLDEALKDQIEKDVGKLKVAQLEDLQKNFDAPAEGSKADRSQAILEAYEGLSGEGKAKLFAEVQRCKIEGNK